MKYLYSFLLIQILFFAGTSVYAQSGKIQGTVKDVQGQLLPGATILVEDNRTGTSSDASGQFEITIKPGQYRLAVSMVGFETIYRDVTVTEGEVTVIDAPLAESNGVLVTCTK